MLRCDEPAESEQTAHRSTGRPTLLQFVLTNHPPRTPPQPNERFTFTFISGDVAEAAARANAAAGEKAVQVAGGPDVIGRLLWAGLVDELHIDVMPVLLGAGLRLFDVVGAASIRLAKTGVAEAEPRTGLWFRVVR